MRSERMGSMTTSERLPSCANHYSAVTSSRGVLQAMAASYASERERGDDRRSPVATCATVWTLAWRAEAAAHAGPPYSLVERVVRPAARHMTSIDGNLVRCHIDCTLTKYFP